MSSSKPSLQLPSKLLTQDCLEAHLIFDFVVKKPASLLALMNLMLKIITAPYQQWIVVKVFYRMAVLKRSVQHSFCHYFLPPRMPKNGVEMCGKQDLWW